MPLTTTQKQKLRQFLHESYCANELETPWTKPDIDQAITDLDTFLEDNQATINSAISVPFRTSASEADKAMLFAAIAAASYILGNSGHAAVLRDVGTRIAELSGS